MKIFRQVTLAAIAIAALATVAPQAMAQSSKFSAKARNLSSIMSEVKTTGRAHVIVEFAVGAADIMTDSGLAARKKAVRAGQDAILTSTFGSVDRAASRGLSRMRIQPMFALVADEAELDALASDSRVVSIYYNDRASPSLIQSVPLIGGKVLKRRGGDGTGFIVGV